MANLHLTGSYSFGEMEIEYDIHADGGRPAERLVPAEEPEIDSMELTILGEDFDPEDIYVRSSYTNSEGQKKSVYNALEDLIFEYALEEERGNYD
jgi:hypothetical protein